jgi:hypothetical protein
LVTTDGANPYLGAYDTYAAQAKTAYQQALARIANQRTGFLQQSGLDASGNALANAPYGAYQQMLGGLAENADAVDAANAASGFKGGGLSRQALAAAQRQARQTSYDFGTQFQQGLSSFADSEAQAGQDYNDQLAAKMAEITQQAIQDQQFTPADYSGLGYEPYGNGSPDPSAPGLPWHPPRNRHRRRRRR